MKKLVVRYLALIGYCFEKKSQFMIERKARIADREGL